MIRSLAHTTIYVNNHEEALAFYTEKLGFEVRMDMSDQGFRWLTVSPKEQRDLELVLVELSPGFMFDDESVSLLKQLLAKGALGPGVFETADCKATYEELSNRGVEFTSEPADKPYGVEATFKDNSGNWFSLVQPKQP